MSTYDAIAGLDLRVDGYSLERMERAVSSEFTRVSTVIRLRGAGEEGVGEDVSYDPGDHDSLRATGAILPLAGHWTLGAFADHVAGQDQWPRPPVWEAARRYRQWAYESAALDLALRQAGAPLHEVLGREPRPVTFVVSMRLGEPATLAPVRRRLDRYPGLRFKLDPTSSWTPELVEALRATGAVDSVDFKGLYEGTVVDQAADPALYRLVVEGFPDAWIEDPRLTSDTDRVLSAHRDRITWDANIHAVADIEALPFAPRMVNVKPSRLGSLRELLGAYDHCSARGIGMYGGGQFELGPGRGQIQLLASLFHPDTPNDVAPGGYNDEDPPDGLPSSPLPPDPAPIGFRWGEWARA